MASGDPLAVALGLALTGERLPVGQVVDLAADLAALGYDANRLARLRAGRQESQQPWPFPVPLDERRALGFARFDAALAALRAELGLTGLRPAAQAIRPLDAHERRLAADRPPHW